MADKTKFVEALEKTPEALAAITAVGIKEVNDGQITIREGITDAELQWRIGQPALNQLVIDNEEEEVLDKHDLTVDFEGCTCSANGEDIDSGTKISLEEGDKVNIIFTPMTAAYQLKSFTVNGGSADMSDNEYEVTMGSEDINIYAEFVESMTLNIERDNSMCSIEVSAKKDDSDDPSWKTIDPESSDDSNVVYKVFSGTEVSIDVKPLEGYNFNYMQLVGQETTIADNPYAITINNNIEIIVTCKSE